MKKLICLISVFCIATILYSQKQRYFVYEPLDKAEVNYVKYKNEIYDKHYRILDSLFRNTPKNKNLEFYYKNIYKAESYIMKNKLENAAKTYKLAFSFIDYPFATDLENALYCELESRKDKDNIKKYIWFLINKGENKDKFLSKPEYQSLSLGEELKTMIDTSKTSVNAELIDIITAIHEDDQAIRKQTGYGSIKRAEEMRLEMGKIDSINYQKIMSLIEEYPTVSEEIYGTKGLNKMDIIPWHNSDFIDIYIALYKSVVNGKLDARYFTRLLDNSDFLINYSLKLGIWKNAISCLNEENFDIPSYFVTINTPKENIVNKYRKLLYLEKYTEQQKKQIWYFRNPKAKVELCNNTGGINNNETFFKTLKTKETIFGKGNKIHYRSKADKKQLQKAMKEYYKNNPEKK